MLLERLIEYYNGGAVTATEVAVRLLEELEVTECGEVLQRVPPFIRGLLRGIVDRYPLDDEDSLVLISNVVISDEELAQRRRHARRNVPVMRDWFARHPDVGEPADEHGAPPA